MGIYIILSRLTDEGAETLKEKPERVKEVNEELEKMGVKVLQQYVVFGEFDFVNIVEAPDNITVMKAMVELASRGTIRTVTMPAVPVDEFLEALKK
ncbi:GYD domain-containing protein [Ferroglobus sp.]|uniref:GYD domain-containing protein n=1 Tax=Ferroglobus sp. TaxID=2614230 RepID=UPI0025B8E575|nr:GYD domain-containing protein [Ferroglobus sp.]